MTVLLAAMTVAAAPAEAKPKRCLTPAEAVAEHDIRHAVLLRDSAQRCDAFSTTDSVKLWTGFMSRFGDRLTNQNGKRARAYQREFPKAWEALLQHADGRLVTYTRNIPLTEAFCANIHQLLAEVNRGGWNTFADQARTGEEQVWQDYKVCR